MSTLEITSVAIQGFKSFAKDTVLEFPGKVGFYLLTGQNRVEPDLGANGSGKSSLWDAITWCLYGKTARGLKAGTVANWYATDLTSVVVEFYRDGQFHAVTRTWNPNVLTIEGHKSKPRVVQQEAVDELVGMDYGTFLHVVLMSQFGLYFFDLGPTEKLGLFSEALNLSFWVERADRAKEQLKGLLAELVALEQEQANRTGRRQALGEQLDKAKADRDAWRLDQEHRQRRAEKQLDREEANSKAQYDAHQSTAKQMAELNKSLKVAQADVATYIEEHTKHERAAAGYDAEIRGCLADVERFKAQIVQLRKLTGKCPTCHQPVKDRQVDRAVDEIKREMQWVRMEQDKVQAKRDEVARLLEQAQGRLDARREVVKHLGGRLAELEAEDRQHTTAMSVAQERLNQARQELTRAKMEVNPHLKTVDDLRATRKRLKVELAEGQAALDTLVRRRKALEFWAGEFKAIRLWIVEEALAELEVEVNNCLVQLGLEGWLVKFDVERETNAGKLAKGFVVTITSPMSQGAVPWEAWSGGETQRLRIAGAIGLANLIRSRRGVNPSLEVWDEPTAHMSEEGIQDMLGFFDARARQEKRQVWLVDHRSLDYGFDGVVKVIKDESGSWFKTKEKRRNGHEQTNRDRI